MKCHSNLTETRRLYLLIKQIVCCSQLSVILALLKLWALGNENKKQAFSLSFFVILDKLLRLGNKKE
jgi:hypothetical protein